MSEMEIIILQKDGIMKHFDAMHCRYVPALVHNLTTNMHTAEDVINGMNNAPYPWNFGHVYPTKKGSFTKNIVKDAAVDPKCLFKFEDRPMSQVCWDRIPTPNDDWRHRDPTLNYIGIGWTMSSGLFIDLIHCKVIYFDADGPEGWYFPYQLSIFRATLEDYRVDKQYFGKFPDGFTPIIIRFDYDKTKDSFAESFNRLLSELRTKKPDGNFWQTLGETMTTHWNLPADRLAAIAKIAA